MTTIYFCKAYNGGTFWASTHCNQHKALIERIARVPVHMSFDQQVQTSQNQRWAASRLHAANATVVNNAAVAAKKSECMALDDQIARWDAVARQPQSAQMQDWMREKRKQARDRPFSLRC